MGRKNPPWAARTGLGEGREGQCARPYPAPRTLGRKMDDFRGLLSQRPGSLRGDVRALGAAGEEPPGPTPARAAYKVGASRRCGGTRGAPRSGSSRPRSEGRARSAGLRAPALPARTMRGRELPLVLLALVLCQAPRGPAAPVPGGQGTVLDKMYPRGNHWAVGECPARSVLGGTPAGEGSAATLHLRPPKDPRRRRPAPRGSWEAVGP